VTEGIVGVNTALTWLAVYEPPVAILHVRGALTVATAVTLRTAALTCLAQTPTAVIIDVDGLVIVDDIAVTVFAAVARHAAAWPAIPILLCSAQPAMSSALHRLGLYQHIAEYPHLAAARAHITRRPASVQLRSRFAPAITSVPFARVLVTDACVRWRLRHLADGAGLVMTELVTNAVRHAHTVVDVTVTRALGHLHLAVRDYAKRLPRMTGPRAEDAPGGRGLLIVENFANHWGVIPTSDGKVIWATFRTTDAQRKSEIVGAIH
jgi:anti-anti-sigma regulatory factor/anti-sigma regulatory factor (Ser/Thr protein kinase)